MHLRVRQEACLHSALVPAGLLAASSHFRCMSTWDWPGVMNCWQHDWLALLPPLQVLCTPSTLALGVNLPAHLVIIKGTRRYCGGASGDGSGYEEYDRSMCLQMAGRAGRPQFDNEGVAVIMTQRQVGHFGGHPALHAPGWGWRRQSHVFAHQSGQGGPC